MTERTTIAHVERLQLLPGHLFAEKAVEIISAAQKSIDISTFVIHGPWKKTCQDKYNVFKAILDAPQRGLSCRLIITDMVTLPTRKVGYSPSLALLKLAGWVVQVPTNGKINHAKLLVVDETKCIIGSHNMTYNSSFSNTELSVYFENRALARDAMFGISSKPLRKI